LAFPAPNKPPRSSSRAGERFPITRTPWFHRSNCTRTLLTPDQEFALLSPRQERPLLPSTICT